MKKMHSFFVLFSTHLKDGGHLENAMLWIIVLRGLKPFDYYILTNLSESKVHTYIFLSI